MSRLTAALFGNDDCDSEMSSPSPGYYTGDKSQQAAYGHLHGQQLYQLQQSTEWATHEGNDGIGGPSRRGNSQSCPGDMPSGTFTFDDLSKLQPRNHSSLPGDDVQGQLHTTNPLYDASPPPSEQMPVQQQTQRRARRAWVVDPTAVTYFQSPKLAITQYQTEQESVGAEATGRAATTGVAGGVVDALAAESDAHKHWGDGTASGNAYQPVDSTWPGLCSSGGSDGGQSNASLSTYLNATAGSGMSS